MFDDNADLDTLAHKDDHRNALKRNSKGNHFRVDPKQISNEYQFDA